MRFFRKLPIFIALGFRSLAMGETCDTCEADSMECICVDMERQPKFAFPSYFYRYQYDDYLKYDQPEATWPTKNTDAFYDAFTR